MSLNLILKKKKKKIVFLIWLEKLTDPLSVFAIRNIFQNFVCKKKIIFSDDYLYFS